MGSSLSTNRFPVQGRTVLITGASRGTGLEAARQLAAKGANVMIVARDAKRLREGVASLREAAVCPETQRFHFIPADLTDAETCIHVMSQATEWNSGQPPDVVWSLVGSAYPHLFVETDISRLRDELTTNYFANAFMAHAALKTWLREPNEPAGDAQTMRRKDAAPRHLVFTSSFQALYSMVGYTSYGPAKTALRSLSDSLSQELHLYAAANPSWRPIRVHTIFPSTIFGESYEAENLVKPDVNKMLEETDPGQTAEVVARKSIQGLESGHELITCDILARFVLSTVFGTSKRGGFFRTLADWAMGCLGLLILIFVRWDMDRKVRNFGRRHGHLGAKRQTE
ncbi:hypothetical protein KVR01_001021 [Diaporthe batatas]|uniref:uncharacterized protein n=1 Tax=Diaporthe batatas TaxID=748121 RepID=UPI001D0508C9|nr:uncharacterized protein KVR01_001021 [Diaporthe batatas]KAG8170276.1 hypothetical protein KVR01_001021 [Diaporthe batatas]